jgi:hypothetical protein
MKQAKLLSFLLSAILTFTYFPSYSLAYPMPVLEPYLQVAQKSSGISAYEHVKALTTEEMGGRQSGTREADMAAEYIAQQFKEIGLHPYSASSYFQEVEVDYFELLPPINFSCQNRSNTLQARYRTDYMIFHYSGKGEVDTKAVFVGYGIQAPELKYNEYENISVNRKMVFMLLDLPSFITDNEQRFTVASRINTAFFQGAKAVVLLLKDKQTPPFGFDMKMSRGWEAPIPVLIASSDYSKTLLKAENIDLEKTIATIEQTRMPQTIALDLKAQIEVNFLSEKRKSQNVIGYIPAIDPKNSESLLITAHYDHLGRDQILNTIYHGANDNASSVGCMIEIARNLMQNNCLPSLNLVFIAFTGEEVGLLGSYEYVRNPRFPLRKTKAVLNMEEVGTFIGDNLAGTNSQIYPELGTMIRKSSSLLNSKIRFIPELLYPGSDHWPFHELGIPSVCFAKLPLPNGYPEYHKTTDTIDIISPESLEIFCHLVSLMVLSYSKASFFDFSSLPLNNSGHPFILTRVPFYAPNEDLSIEINKQSYAISTEEHRNKELSLFIPLKTGTTAVLFEINYKQKRFKELDFTIRGNTQEKLRADFNQDLQMNLLDLQAFSRKWESPAPPYSNSSLYDLNQDQVINMEDFHLLQDLYN